MMGFFPLRHRVQIGSGVTTRFLCNRYRGMLPWG